MEDRADANSLYVLISLLGTVISLPVVWYFTETAQAASRENLDSNKPPI